jgi:hypothetical protein
MREGHTHDERIKLKDVILIAAIMTAVIVPVVFFGLLRSWQAAKHDCRQTGEGMCCRAEKSGDAIRVYLDDMERGHYLVRTKTVGDGLEYCHTRQ